MIWYRSKVEILMILKLGVGIGVGVENLKKIILS
jgi:hypothetical protein